MVEGAGGGSEEASRRGPAVVRAEGGPMMSPPLQGNSWRWVRGALVVEVGRQWW